MAGIAFGSDGSLYIANSSQNRVRKVSPTRVISTVAGNGDPSCPTVDPSTGRVDCGDGGSALSARLGWPESVAVGAEGVLYIADTNHDSIRKVDAAGIITTLVGLCGRLSFFRPSALAIGPDGSLYYAGEYSNRVRKLNPAGEFSTIAGTGNYGFSGDGGPATAATAGCSWRITRSS